MVLKKIPSLEGSAKRRVGRIGNNLIFAWFGPVTAKIAKGKQI